MRAARQEGGCRRAVVVVLLLLLLAVLLQLRLRLLQASRQQGQGQHLRCPRRLACPGWEASSSSMWRQVMQMLTVESGWVLPCGWVDRGKRRCWPQRLRMQLVSLLQGRRRPRWQAVSAAARVRRGLCLLLCRPAWPSAT